jgi:hypothetical protein
MPHLEASKVVFSLPATQQTSHDGSTAHQSCAGGRLAEPWLLLLLCFQCARQEADSSDSCGDILPDGPDTDSSGDEGVWLFMNWCFFEVMKFIQNQEVAE